MRCMRVRVYEEGQITVAAATCDRNQGWGGFQCSPKPTLAELIDGLV